MTKSGKITVWVSLTVILLAAGIVLFLRHQLRPPATIIGAVTVQDLDPHKQLPIANVEITANDLAVAPTRSDAAGFFKLTLGKSVRRRQVVELHFRHPKYQPLDMEGVTDGRLYMARLLPLSQSSGDVSNRSATSVANIRVRYSIQAVRTMNVGSAVKTFQVENRANVPCKGQVPCSPDGKWKAAIGSTELDAGVANEFQNARVSCIAGPCPFTRIESERFSRSSQKITAVARNWSDTATFLVEAEVVHVMQSQIDHQSYPAVFGPSFNFTLPSNAEGVTLEADISGETIIFPLGPNLFLSWATCTSSPNRDQPNIYRCQLKPGYRFPA
jgi:hypothetical protein